MVIFIYIPRFCRQYGYLIDRLLFISLYCLGIYCSGNVNKFLKRAAPASLLELYLSCHPCWRLGLFGHCNAT